MSGQGYHLAISPAQARNLLTCGQELDIVEAVNDLLEHLEGSQPINLCGGTKDWNLILLCLTDGTYDPTGGTYPLNQCFFGGKLLVSGGSIVNLVMPNVVSDVAPALAALERQWFVGRFSALFAEENTGGIPAGAYETYWQAFQQLRDFYERAAATGQAIVFYTDDCLSYFFDAGGNPSNRR
jgi:Domain of unknown function (DUF1877)